MALGREGRLVGGHGQQFQQVAQGPVEALHVAGRDFAAHLTQPKIIEAGREAAFFARPVQPGVQPVQRVAQAFRYLRHRLGHFLGRGPAQARGHQRPEDRLPAFPVLEVGGGGVVGRGLAEIGLVRHEHDLHHVVEGP